MYKYLSSYLKPRASNTAYSNINVSNKKISDILNNYTDGWIKLSHTALSHDVYLTLDALRSTKLPMNHNLTFRAYLSFIGNLALDTIQEKPEYSIGVVTARDALLAGYNVNMCAPYKEAFDSTPVSDKTNLLISKQYLPIDYLHNQTLVSVNGFVHRCVPRPTKLEVLGGGRTWMYAGDRTCSIINFNAVGNIKQIPITANIIHRVSPATPYHTSVVLDLNMDITNKSLILVLGGYMFVANEFARVVSSESGTVKINLNRIDIAQCVLNSYDFIDLEVLGLSKEDLTRSNGSINTDKINDDIFVRGWLTLPQSFVVVVDTPTLTVETIDLQTTGVYGAFEHHECPTLPLQDSYGRLLDYWIKRQHRTWVVQVPRPQYSPRLDYTGTSHHHLISGGIPYHTEWREPPKLLKITGTRPVH